MTSADLNVSPALASAVPPLSAAMNDTGRTVWCGPVALAAITGEPASRIEGLIAAYRAAHPEAGASKHKRAWAGKGAEAVVMGTSTVEVAAALADMGWRMRCVWLRDRSKTTFARWLQRPRIAYRYHLIGLRAGRVGHWVALKGVMLADTYSGGRWGFAVDSRHMGARLLDVHEVWREGEG